MRVHPPVKPADLIDRRVGVSGFKARADVEGGEEGVDAIGPVGGEGCGVGEGVAVGELGVRVEVCEGRGGAGGVCDAREDGEGVGVLRVRCCVAGGERVVVCAGGGVEEVGVHGGADGCCPGQPG